jgi:KEOPS complex subunit Cgi121
MITVFGALGTIIDTESFLSKLLMFSKDEQIVIQVINAQLVYGTDHLLSSAEHALRAFEQKTNATNSLSLEILLYAAGERQIQKAIKKMGVTKGKQHIAFVIVDEQKKKSDKKTYDAVIERLLQLFHFTRDDKVLEGDKDTLKRFGITDQEIHTIPESKYGDLILEKVAMVDIIK